METFLRPESGYATKKNLHIYLFIDKIGDNLVLILSCSDVGNKLILGSKIFFNILTIIFLVEFVGKQNLFPKEKQYLFNNSDL